MAEPDTLTPPKATIPVSETTPDAAPNHEISPESATPIASTEAISTAQHIPEPARTHSPDDIHELPATATTSPPAMPARPRESPAEPRIVALRAMFPDFDDLLL